MKIDDLRYKLDEIKSRFDGVDTRKLLTIGGGVSLLVILTVVMAVVWWPEPGIKITTEDMQRADEVSGLSMALAQDSRFSFVRVVASPDENGKIKFQLMGSVASKSDLEALRSVVSTEKPNSDVSWAVGVAPPDA